MKVRQLRWRFYRKTGGPRGWGNRCNDYGPGCILCEMYRFLDNHGRFPTEAERMEVCDEVLGNPPRESLQPPSQGWAQTPKADPK